MYLDYILLCIVSLFIFELREPLLKFQRNEMPVMFSFLSRPDHRILLPGIFPFEVASKNSYEAPIVENNNLQTIKWCLHTCITQDKKVHFIECLDRENPFALVVRCCFHNWLGFLKTYRKIISSLEAQNSILKKKNKIMFTNIPAYKLANWDIENIW